MSDTGKRKKDTPEARAVKIAAKIMQAAGQKGGKKMKRTQVFLPEQLIYKLEQLADKKGVSKGEIIRRALEEYVAQEDKP